MIKSCYDIVIVGGGMVGASFACALKNENLNVALIEKTPLQASHQPSYDDRGLALSLSSKYIFQALGLWQQLAHNANPIQHIHISDQGHFGCVRLHADMLKLEALGYVVIANDLGQALMAEIKECANIDFICPAEVKSVDAAQDNVVVNLIDKNEENIITGKLLVVADGANSIVRQQAGIKARIEDYQQTAIVMNVIPENSHDNTAYERFTATGPIALLPLAGDRCKLVYTVPGNEADTYLKMDDAACLERLQQRFGRRLGRFSNPGQRTAYPLMLVEAEEQVRHRMVLLGNSVHAIHPNGAQGFNLGLRDVAALAEHITSAIRGGDDPGCKRLLEAYVNNRRSDQQRVINFSDKLVSLFYNQDPMKTFIRNTGLLVTDLVPCIKKEIIRKATGIWGRQPVLAQQP